jgi:hypothetical protein
MTTFGDSADIGDPGSLRVYSILSPTQAVALFDSGQKTLVAGPNDFPVRFAVEGGETLGIVPGGTGSCGYSTEDPLDTYLYNVGADPLNTPFTADPVAGYRMDVSAVVEPDADKDGFGDETQDQCPADATTQGACDLTGPTPDISKGPKKKAESRKATFKFTSDDPNATFQCRLDKKAFADCTSPKKYRKLKPRKHRFRVQATDPKGNVGPKDSFSWRVVD